MCSTVRKAIARKFDNCKAQNIWKHRPANWPHQEVYSDPRNSNRSVYEVEHFLSLLLRCCGNTVRLSRDINSEIDVWHSLKSKDNAKLLNLYTFRVCRRSIEQSVNLLQSHVSTGVLEFKVDIGLQVILSCQPTTGHQLITKPIYRAEATRKIASFLCRIIHGKNPDEKCDHIWKETPDGWPLDCRFYNPYNGGKRHVENEDTRLVTEMINLCTNKSIKLQRPFQNMVIAWLAGDQTSLSKLIKRHTAETNLKGSMRKLHERGLLRDTEIIRELKKLGIIVECDENLLKTKSQVRILFCIFKKSN